jgi:hypothetical protein
LEGRFHGRYEDGIETPGGASRLSAGELRFRVHWVNAVLEKNRAHLFACADERRGGSFLPAGCLCAFRSDGVSPVAEGAVVDVKRCQEGCPDGGIRRLAQVERLLLRLLRPLQGFLDELLGSLVRVGGPTR